MDFLYIRPVNQFWIIFACFCSSTFHFPFFFCYTRYLPTNPLCNPFYRICLCLILFNQWNTRHALFLVSRNERNRSNSRYGDSHPIWYTISYRFYSRRLGGLFKILAIFVSGLFSDADLPGKSRYNSDMVECRNMSVLDFAFDIGDEQTMEGRNPEIFRFWWII